MDLFLVSNASTRTEFNVLILVGLGLVGIVGIYKLFSSLEANDSDDEQDNKNQRAGKPAGIFNEGNTCFVNSLLQALSSLDSFQHLLQQISNRFRGQISNNEQLIVQLNGVLKEINNSNDSISIGRLLDTISSINQDLINLQQQDAHQLYIAIISCVESVLNKQKYMDLSVSTKVDKEIEEQEMENPLIGYIKSSSICMTCKTETSIKIDPFYDLSLDISKMTVNNIHTALAQFQRQERIDSWICTNCSLKNHCFKLRKNMTLLKGQNAQKLTFICKDILQFLQEQSFQEHQIKELNFKLGNFVKLYATDFQKMGDDPQKELIFIQIEGKESSILKRSIIIKYPKILVLHMKQLVLNPMTGQPFLLKKHIYFSQSLKIQTRYKTKQYRLTSLLTHIGNQLYGHYLSFRRSNRDSNQWFVMNDSTSQKASWEMVRQSRAYMLFYQTD